MDNMVLGRETGGKDMQENDGEQDCSSPCFKAVLEQDWDSRVVCKTKRFHYV